MTLIFIFAVATIPSFVQYAGGHIGVLILVALFVTLIPTTIGALLSAIGIAGMDRLIRFNVLAMSGPGGGSGGGCRYAAAGQDRHHHDGQPAGRALCPGVGGDERASLADAAQLASLADETPEGRRSSCWPSRSSPYASGRCSAGCRFVPLTAQTRMSGVDIGPRRIRKGGETAYGRGGR
jgi:K+-transporting ATPase ATPase B chain